jgi:acyl-coenzyme A synthetase/AMP-(fatty) acid ligase
VQILKRALEAPARQIAENSAVDGGVVVARMLEGRAIGFDAGRKEYVDLIEAGIIDPTKVVRIALENAVSVASVLLLTEATMTEIPEIGEARVLVTTEALYRRKVAPVRDALPALTHILLVGTVGGELPPGGVMLEDALRRADAGFVTVPTRPDDMALLHFTSGTTGRPKGAIHVHEAVVAHRVTGRYALDLHPDDVFWCTADPGWVTGMSYGVIAPLTIGVT